MTLHRGCLLFVGISLIASLVASMSGHPERWWWFALILGSVAGWYVTQLDPLKGTALAMMALRGAVIVLWDMGQDFASTFIDRYRGRYDAARQSLKEWD